jgi:transglutaminase-like putative cysteine protease
MGKSTRPRLRQRYLRAVSATFRQRQNSRDPLSRRSQREGLLFGNGSGSCALPAPEKLVPINETFRTLAEKAAAGKTDNLERAKALYDHVMGRMRYDKSGPGWGHGDAMYACDAHTGNCTDFHAYFIALARSIGIPARFAIGATIPADKNEGTIDGYHCWAEFLADGRWVPVDISEAWKNRKFANYYFGHNPANRFELTKGRDLVVDPEPTSGPINFLAYPLLEMNGEVIKPETTFTFRRIGA